MTTVEPLLLRQDAAGVSTLTLNRASQFNSLSKALLSELQEELDAIARDATIRVVVISGAGDRRDCDIRMQTEILGDVFDEVILYQDDCQRGRADGEVLGLLREGLSQARRTTQTEEIRGELLAIDTALSRLHPGDLCLMLIDRIEEALAHITLRTTEPA